MVKSIETATAKIAPFGLRLAPQVKTALEVAAKQSGRSLNAEIAHRLEASLTQTDVIEKLRTMVEDLLRRMEAVENK